MGNETGTEFDNNNTEHYEIILTIPMEANNDEPSNNYWHSTHWCI